MVSLIAAIGSRRELGKNNRLLWNIPEDLKRFKQLTSGHPVIMGRKTYQSIGRLLPNRTNIIITHNSSFIIPSAQIVHSLEDAIKVAKESEGNDKIFVIGGGQIFQQALPLADKLYLTIVDKEFEADTFFPDYSMFRKIVHKKEGKSGEYSFMFLDLELIA